MNAATVAKETHMALSLAFGTDLTLLIPEFPLLQVKYNSEAKIKVAFDKTHF
jgi:hypothetical protein